MPFSIRLDAHTERVVRRLARRSGRTKSDVIRQAIAALDQDDVPSPRRPTAYERLAHLIGTARGGDRRLSDETGKRFAELLQVKQRARRPR